MRTYAELRKLAVFVWHRACEELPIRFRERRPPPYAIIERQLTGFAVRYADAKRLIFASSVGGC